MNEQIDMKLEEEISRIEGILKTLKPGTDEYSKTADVLQVCYHLRTERSKAQWAYEEAREKRLYESGRADEEQRLKELEYEMRRDQTRREKIINRIKIAMDATKIVGGTVLGLFLCYAGFKFEEKGTFTSKIFGRIIDSVFKKITK